MNSFNAMKYRINPLNAELNPFCHLLALLGAHHILHVSGVRVNQKKKKQEHSFELMTTKAKAGYHTRQGLVLRRFVLRRFTFMTLVESHRALPTCGASLSQLQRPFCTSCACSSFPVCMCFLFLYFSAVLFKLIAIFPPVKSIKKTEKNKSEQLTLHSFLYVF